MGNTSTKPQLDREASAYAKSRREALDQSLQDELKAAGAANDKVKAENAAFSAAADQRWKDAQREFKEALAAAAVDAAKRSPEVRVSETRVIQAKLAIDNAEAYRTEAMARWMEMMTRGSEAVNRWIDALARKNEAEARCYESRWRPVEELEKEEALAREEVARNRKLEAEILEETTRAYDEAIRARDDEYRSDKQSGGDSVTRIAAATARKAKTKERDKRRRESPRSNGRKRKIDAKARAGEGATVDERWQKAVQEFEAYLAEAYARRMEAEARSNELEAVYEDARKRTQAAEAQYEEVKKAHAALVETVVDVAAVHREYEAAEQKYNDDLVEIERHWHEDPKKHEQNVAAAKKLHQVAVEEVAIAERTIDEVIVKEKERHARELEAVKSAFEAKLVESQAALDKAVAESKRLEEALEAARAGKGGGFLDKLFS